MDQELLDGQDRVIIEPPQQQFPSHVQAYDILRRIGELEDAKQSISLEIDECMGQLQAIAVHIDEDSLLNNMLNAVFPRRAAPRLASHAAEPKPQPKRKKAKRKNTKKPAAKKATAKKKSKSSKG